MVADPPAKIPSDEEFGQRVIKAREERGWNQEQLAKRVGTSQPTISAIESGGASSWIPEVCRVLKIPGPMFGFTDEQKQWAIIGHKLQGRSPATFTMALGMIQKMLDELDSAASDPPPTPPPRVPEKPKKPMRPIGSANLSGLPGGDRELRPGGEIPGETKRRR